MQRSRGTRTSRAIAAVVGAILAVGLVAPGAALATELHSEVEPTFLYGEQVVMNRLDTTNPFEASVKCNKVIVRGEMTGKAAKEISLLPQYNECTYLGQPTTWNQNECRYVFSSFAGSSPNFVGGMSIQCPPLKYLELTVGASTPPICTITIVAQTPLVNSLDYANQGVEKTRDFRLTWTVTGISYTVKYPGPPGSEACGEAGTRTNGKFTGTITVKGFKNMALTEQAGIWIE